MEQAVQAGRYGGSETINSKGLSGWKGGGCGGEGRVNLELVFCYETLETIFSKEK